MRACASMPWTRAYSNRISGSASTSHIVETKYNSGREDGNSRCFADRLEARENRVLIPTWKHVEISSWYSTRNDAYGGLTPRAYLRGRSWEQQDEVGLRTLRLYGGLE